MLRCSLLVLLIFAVIMPAWGVLPPTPPPTFTATMIAGPGFADLHPTGLNSLDQACGYFSNKALGPGFDPDTAILWSQSGGMVFLGTSRAYSLNRTPTIVGDMLFGLDQIPFPIATVWSKTGQNWPSNVKSTAYAINNLGQIAGYETIRIGITLVPKPVVWYGNKKTFPLGSTGSITGSVYGMNDNNTVVGQFNGNAFIVKNGILKTLGPGAALAVDPNGNAVGYTDIFGTQFPTLWGFTGIKFGLPPIGYAGSALACNGRNVIVGTSVDFSGLKTATMWISMSPFDLNALTTGVPAGWQLTKAVGINDKGNVLCEGEDATGNTRAFFLKR